MGAYTLQQVLKVLSNSIKHVPNDRAEALQKKLLEPVNNFSFGVELISSMMDTITLLSYKLHGDEAEGKLIKTKCDSDVSLLYIIFSVKFEKLLSF